MVNVIVTAIGGENSVQGAKRFENTVLKHNPDVLYIDYGLNDRAVGLSESYKAWDEMIKKAKSKNIKIILLTPSPDLTVNYSNPNNELKKHTDQIIRLAKGTWLLAHQGHNQMENRTVTCENTVKIKTATFKIEADFKTKQLHLI